MQSLLGLFYKRIKGSQEDIASEGLSYILNKSFAAQQAIKNIIFQECGIQLPGLSFSTQNIGENLERPDISVSNENGKEVLLIEAKFWASLTDNQPNRYLERLGQNGVLLIICPSERVGYLYDEIRSRLKVNSCDIQEKPETHSFILPKNQFVIIKKWDEILTAVKTNLIGENNLPLISDIDQIIGFCKMIDSESFLPIINDDLSPKFARRICSYYDLVDNVIGELVKRGKADLSKLKATPQKYGYTRYFKINNLGASLNLAIDLWAKNENNAFWVYFKEIDSENSNWIITEKFRNECKNIALLKGLYSFEDAYKNIYISINPLVGAVEEQVVSDMADKIILLADHFSKGD